MGNAAINEAAGANNCTNVKFGGVINEPWCWVSLGRTYLGCDYLTNKQPGGL